MSQTIDRITQPEPASRARGNPYSRAVALRPIDLRLDANEGGDFAAGVIGPLAADTELVRRYPDASRLEAILAKRLGVDATQIVVTAGADDALLRACNALLEAGRSAAYCVPTFEMLRRYVRSTGAQAIEVDWPPVFPTDQLIAAAKSSSLVFVVSPNNPTGAIATRRDLIRLREELPNAVIVLDAAYAEFSDESVANFALTMPWTIVTRTFSKAWGAAGLRVGYAAGDARVISWLHTVGQPYACSALSLACAETLLLRGEQVSRVYVQRVRDERSALEEWLRELGADPIPSEANFVLVHFRDAPLVADLLAGLGIAVRRFSPESGLANALRIGCPGDSTSFTCLTRALRAALRPQVLLFARELNLTPRIIESLRDRFRVEIIDASALQQLGRTSAWMLCATLDDIRTARAAGVVPIAYRSDEQLSKADETALLSAGAARIISTPAQLLEILP